MNTAQKLPTTVLIVIALLLAVDCASLHLRGGEKSAPPTESAYERVLNTGTLRCGYTDWPPHVLTKDPTTGKISGLLAETTEAVAAKLGLKVEWAENTGWGSLVESLRSHRIDAFCAGAWRSAEKGRFVAFGLPIFYSAVYPYVGANDHRFDQDLSIANNPNIRIAAMDGEVSDEVAKKHFPQAKEVSIPQLGQITDILENVAKRKADMVFNEPSFVEEYMKANPNKLRRAQDKPFQFFPTSYCVEIHETQLKEMLDSALVELQNDGTIDQIITRYSATPQTFLRVATPYAER